MRRLVGALACRNEGSRLRSKPLQNLDVESGVTILDHIISMIQKLPSIDDIVLGISEGNANLSFVDLANRRDLKYIIGDEKDVLYRLIQCAHKGEATDVFRVTTESPYFYYEKVAEAWERHVENGNDVTVIDGVPEGSHFEIYKLTALEASHQQGEDRHRSEYCSRYITENRNKFKVGEIEIPKTLERLDLRLTVDNPEDLVVCRSVYAHLKHKAPLFPLSEIVDYLDAHPELKKLVDQYVVPQRIW